jgi:predicted Rossmann fold flavoprotein
VDGRRGVIVVGGGAAGLVAAIAAARAGAPVTVLERMPRVGKKLLATGNGRCNLANARLGLERYHGRDPAFARAALETFGLEPTLAFFAGLGVAPREEDAGKIFPRSGQASSVLDLLRHELAHRGVETRCDAPVTRIAPRGGSWEVAAGGDTLRCAAVVLASGGRASPQLGSNGSGYDLALSLGHRLVAPFPALTRIRAASPFLRHLKGVKVDGTATLVSPVADRRHGPRALRGAGACSSGEILFTETGLSGPPILDLSRRAGERALRRQPTLVRLDLCPEIAADVLADTLRRRFSGRPAPVTGGAGTSAELALVGFLHKRLIGPVLATAGVRDAAARPAGSLGEREVLTVAATLKGWDFEVTGTDSWTDAQVTAGGIEVADVDPATLESRVAPGLFIAGEVLDVDGDCGGFNLQWAWSSGHVAGAAAAARVRARR